MSLIGVFILLSSFGKGQSLFFDKYYKVGYNNVLTSNVLLLEDTSYVCLNYIKDSVTGQQNLSLLKIDKYGSPIQKKIHDFGADYLAYLAGLEHFHNLTNSSIAVSAITYTNANSFSTVILNKINKQSLDTIRNTIYNDGVYNYALSSFVKINTNKYFLIGNKFDAVNYWPVFFELDSNLVIKNIITSSNTPSVSTKSAIYNQSTKKIILSGSKPAGFNYYSFISICDTTGNITNTYINSTSDNGIAQVIYSAYDNTYITLGAKKTSIYGSQTMYRMFVCKYDINLNLVWQKTYGKSNMINGLNDAVVNPDGSIVTVGRYSDSVNNPLTNINCNAVMLKLRSNGDSLWMKEFDSLNNTTGPSNNWWETFEGIEKTPEGGYIMCGNAQQMPKGEAWIVKTDSLGCELSACMPAGIQENSQNKSGSVYPNPASSFIYLDLPNGVLNPEIEIIDMLGNIVAKHPPGTEKINIEKLIVGVYFIKIQTENHIPYYMKFIKE